MEKISNIQNPSPNGIKSINEPDIYRIYDLLGKLLSEDLDCEVRFSITRKEVDKE